MFVTKEKHNALVAEKESLRTTIDGLQLELDQKNNSLHEALTKIDVLQAKIDELESRDLEKEIAKLKADLSLVTTQSSLKIKNIEEALTTAKNEKAEVESKVVEKEKEIAAVTQRNADLQATVDRLNNTPPTPPANPLSSGDDDGTADDLDQFCAKNSDNKEAIFARFEKEGI